MFTCHCLNVALEADFSQEPEPLDAFEEQFDGLLGDHWKMGKVRSVTRTHPSLTRHVQMGQWRVERCLNCGQYTHAINPSRPGRGWLNAKLLDEQAANNLKSSDLVSAIFNVVINPNGVDVDTCHPVDSWYGNVEGAVNDLNGVASCYIGKEQARIEEEIRKFSEQQYEQLNNLKEKAMKERETLVRNAIKESLDLDAPPTPKSPLPPPQKVTSHDDDVMLMFPFEEPFEQPKSVTSDDSDDDVIEDVAREGVAIPHQRQQSCGVAKSCPVDIPNYVPRKSNRDVMVVAPDSRGNATQFDIAANIKALAKSVHGDAIFGELPRPKFSTQI